jgi:hypothetical protein
MEKKDFYIDDDSFNVWLPSVEFIEKSGDKYNSRQIVGIMSTSRVDRQGENVLAKGLDISQFLKGGHFNDNHDQATSAIVGYPEEAFYKSDLEVDGESTDGYICRGYVLKGTKRADAIWELAKALKGNPNKRLGFSIEGKVARRKNKVIEKAVIRNVAITNCPVNTDATWNILEKSFHNEEIAMKSLSAGVGISPATQTNGSALRVESLDSDEKDMNKKDKKKKDVLKSALGFDDLIKAMDNILIRKPDYTIEQAARVVALMVQGKL